jgi:hypothetical protein
MTALTIAYSVLDSGLANIALPPARDGVEILIIIQGSGGTAPSRDDVRTVRLTSRGVTASRNEAIREAAGEVLLFGEEGVTWVDDGVAHVLEIFADNPRLAVFLGRAIDENGKPRKRYPDYREPATQWNSARVGTIELAVRPDALRRAGVFFDESFGAGTENFLGDEFIFVADANRAKLKCEYFPVTISRHPRESSGVAFGTERDARARSRVFTRVFGPLAPVMRAAMWLRNPARFGSIAIGVRFVTGAFPK